MRPSKEYILDAQVSSSPGFGRIGIGENGVDGRRDALVFGGAFLAALFIAAFFLGAARFLEVILFHPSSLEVWEPVGKDWKVE
jgi:hypothetical protein